MKILAFGRNHGREMQNRRLGVHSEVILAITYRIFGSCILFLIQLGNQLFVKRSQYIKKTKTKKLLHLTGNRPGRFLSQQTPTIKQTKQSFVRSSKPHKETKTHPILTNCKVYPKIAMLCGPMGSATEEDEIHKPQQDSQMSATHQGVKTTKTKRCQQSKPGQFLGSNVCYT